MTNFGIGWAQTRWLSWRSILAIAFFSSGLLGFLSGVEVSERDLSNTSTGTLAYYSLGLFILGGMDLGAPVGGPVWGQCLLWIGYFGAPLLTTSALLDWFHQVMHNQTRWLQKLNNHIILIGANDIALSIIEKLHHLAPEHKVLIVDQHLEQSTSAELASRYNALAINGDYTNEFLLEKLGIERAKMIIVAADNDFSSLESASKILKLRPELGENLIIHCNRIRFMRQFLNSRVMQESITFNSYQLAARHLVKQVMLAHFEHTIALDTVVLAGFGRFGQIVLEELQILAAGEIAQIGIIDLDAKRRVMVAEEQFVLSDAYTLHIIEGDISHPEVWRNVELTMDLQHNQPLILLATGADDENLRVGMWLQKKHENAKVMVRSTRPSVFANAVGEDTGIYTFGLSQVIHDALPDAWFKQPQQRLQADHPTLPTSTDTAPASD